MYECSTKYILLKTNGKCEDLIGWKKAHFGQYLCHSHATTSFFAYDEDFFYVLLAVECLWMIKLNKTIINVLVYAESTPDTIQLKHLYIFNYSDTFRII